MTELERCYNFMGLSTVAVKCNNLTVVGKHVGTPFIYSYCVYLS
jgi:hypothetical protein